MEMRFTSFRHTHPKSNNLVGLKVIYITFRYHSITWGDDITETYVRTTVLPDRLHKHTADRTLTCFLPVASLVTIFCVKALQLSLNSVNIPQTVGNTLRVKG